MDNEDLGSALLVRTGAHGVEDVLEAPLCGGVLLEGGGGVGGNGCALAAEDVEKGGWCATPWCCQRDAA